MRLFSAIAAVLLAVPSTEAMPAPVGVRLYTLDCGRIDFVDMSTFSDTGDHDGERGAMPVPCFLIRHGADWMLWDAGRGDEIAASPGGREMVGLHFRVPVTLKSQQATLGLNPDDIRYVGLSHLHADTAATRHCSRMPRSSCRPRSWPGRAARRSRMASNPTGSRRCGAAGSNPPPLKRTCSATAACA